MAEEIVKILRFQTTEAVRSVKDLKDNIRECRDELARLNNIQNRSEEEERQLKEATDLLRQSQQALNEVNFATKNSTEAAAGSYDDLNRQLQQARKDFKALDAEQRANAETGGALLQKIQALDAELKGIDASMGQFQRNVGNYPSAMAGAMNMTNALKNGFGSLNMLVTATAGSSEEWRKIMGGVTAAMMVMQGANALGGLLKGLQAKKAATEAATVSARAHTAATEAETAATEGATAATKGFKAALISTGIGALVVALGELVAHWQEVARWMGLTNDATADMLGATDRLKDANKEANDEMARQVRLMEAGGATTREVIAAKQQLVQAQIEETKTTIAATEARLAQVKADDRWWKVWQGTRKQVRELNDELDGLNGLLADLENSAKNLDVDLQVYNMRQWTESTKGLADAMRDLDRAMLSVDTEAAALKETMADLDAAIADALQADEERARVEKAVHDDRIRRIEYERQTRDAWSKAVIDDQEELAAELYRSQMEADRQRLDALRAYYEEVQAMGDADAMAETWQAIQDTETAMMIAGIEERRRLREAEQGAVRASWNTMIGTSSAVLGSLADIYESYSKDDEKSQRGIKNLRIASSIIDTLSGAVGAFTQASKTYPPPYGQVIGAASAAAVTAAGMAQIAKIRATNVSTSAAAAAAPAMTSAPVTIEEVPVTRSITGDDEAATLQTSQRVYIVESDIQAAGKRVQVVNDETTFGGA